MLPEIFFWVTLLKCYCFVCIPFPNATWYTFSWGTCSHLHDIPKKSQNNSRVFSYFFPICFQITFQNKMKHSKHTTICDWHFPAQKPVRDELIFSERKKRQNNFRLEILRLERDHCCFCFQVKINVLGRYFKNLFKTTMYNIFDLNYSWV